MSDVINHGIKSNSLIVMTFKEHEPTYGIQPKHYYTLMYVKDHLVKLYNPHGKILVLPLFMCFLNLETITISYFENKLLRIPEIKTCIEFQEFWPELNRTKQISFVEYDLLVEEDDSEVLQLRLLTGIFDSENYQLIKIGDKKFNIIEITEGLKLTTLFFLIL